MTSESLHALSELSALLNRSLPSYLSDAAPYFCGDSTEAADVLGDIVANQRSMVERIRVLIVESNGIVESGKFPLYFSGFHDLSIEYLISDLINEQKQLIGTIEEIRIELSLVPQARTLAEESLGEARGHLDSLEEVAAGLSQTSS